MRQKLLGSSTESAQSRKESSPTWQFWMVIFCRIFRRCNGRLRSSREAPSSPDHCRIDDRISKQSHRCCRGIGYGYEVQFLEDGIDLFYGGGAFATRALAVRWATVERKALALSVRVAAAWSRPHDIWPAVSAKRRCGRRSGRIAGRSAARWLDGSSQ